MSCVWRYNKVGGVCKREQMGGRTFTSRRGGVSVTERRSFEAEGSRQTSGLMSTVTASRIMVATACNTFAAALKRSTQKNNHMTNVFRVMNTLYICLRNSKTMWQNVSTTQRTDAHLRFVCPASCRMLGSGIWRGYRCQ